MVGQEDWWLQHRYLIIEKKKKYPVTTTNCFLLANSEKGTDGHKRNGI